MVIVEVPTTSRGLATVYENQNNIVNRMKVHGLRQL